MKNIPEDDDLVEAPYESENLLQGSWIDRRKSHSSSGRGRGTRGRGRGRTRGGRSQRRATNSRSESAQRNTTTSERFGRLLGWKGRSRGRGGGRKRSRRTARSRQKPVKRVVEIGNERDQQQNEIFFDNDVIRSSDPQWNTEETVGIQVEAAENGSSSERSEYDDYNGLAAGDEYDDLLADDYSRVFDGKSEHLIAGVDYVDGEEEDDDDRVDEGDDDMEEEEEEDEEEEDDSDEEGQADTDVERYINGDTDEEGNPDGGEQIGNNPDEATGSSSSDYSDD
ncbi:hypothetical protein U1Q18_001621 [Sarracenia purpurea var. burkii]